MRKVIEGCRKSLSPCVGLEAEKDNKKRTATLFLWGIVYICHQIAFSLPNLRPKGIKMQ